MTSSDVRAILNLPQAGPSAPTQRKATRQKPDGISRELYALIGDNAPSLAEAQASLSAVKYRERPTIRSKVHCQFEYDQHLADPDWTSQETAYLFDLLKTYDLRFIIAADRYAYQSKKRSVEYASELFHLTAAEIAEEEALYIEIKRMEQNERRYRADRDDLMRTVMGLDSGLVEFNQSNVETIFGIDKPVHLRSTKIPLPKPNASIRISELLNELGISAHKLVMPTRGNIEIFDSLLQAAGALIDMKRQVDRVEQELRTVTAQRQGLLPTIETRKVRSESVTSTDTTTTNRRSRPL
ncbi:uncharacterized protein IL334_007797 [Kwoniella shivajii]|uniref:SWR1-complex protein 4 n=1 Tax=Kwoniella shivajii TaxID=564305 RepID=A0ABZ1DAH9_9TREE|nr:hypothetical protein IL334_007797 [Kwoniella shivajii]